MDKVLIEKPKRVEKLMQIDEGMLQERDNGHEIFYRRLRFPEGISQSSWLFLGGYASDVSGIKASFLWDLAKQTQTNCTLFDYFGCGSSSGSFEEGTIRDWKANALSILDQLTQGPQVLIGSSMGGWLALLLAKERPQRVSKIVTIAAAPDFPEELFQELSDQQKQHLEKQGEIYVQTREGSFLRLSRSFIEEARCHSILNQQLTFSCPVCLLHGTEDLVVPWHYSQKLFEHINAPFLSLTFVQKGDHRLNRTSDLDLLGRLIRQP